MSGIPMLNGNLHPPIGFGTYKIGYLPPSSASALAGTEVSNPVDCAAVVCTALSNGYRFIDCAEFYGNEDKVGDGIAQWKSKGGNVDDLFIVSKIWTSTLSSSPSSAIKSQVLKTLTDLNIPKIDIIMIHWPVPTHHISAYHTLCECVDEGLVGGLGVSNYGIEDYNDLMSSNPKYPPLINQIEINPFLYRSETIQYFQDKGIVMQSYRSLRDGKEFKNPILLEIAEKSGKSVAQILGRWCIQRNVVYIPKSVKEERIIENFNVFDFELSESDMEIMDGLTTEQAKEKFIEGYRVGVVRGTDVGVEEVRDVTLD
ncbi:hypothetical protein TrLO_g9766 [Triparma laevis f. longispina]|uniref:NADP-dependent oxidoreductase domain-containing protein n=1 Tax=Triparma laevis f. longispina TaxID=1714387 RepID=A0A9W7FR67_9STRA|nr:hypothetical protein TrLO_g9766 [Triparma laevis f. longispina]